MKINNVIFVGLAVFCLIAYFFLLPWPQVRFPTEMPGARETNCSDYFSCLLELVGPETQTGQCLKQQLESGWSQRLKDRPLYVLALGTEGTGHHALLTLLNKNVLTKLPMLHLHGKPYTVRIDARPRVGPTLGQGLS
jgi:hypothetical protein